MLEPSSVILADGFEHAVVREFVPGFARPLLPADDVGIFQQANHAVGQTVAGLCAHQNLPANAIGGDQLAVEPLADAALPGVGLLGHVFHAGSVVIGQRLVDIAHPGQVGFVDVVVILGQALPQAETNHLELHRLNARPELLLQRAIRQLHLGTAQVIHQFLGGALDKFNTLGLGRFLDGLQRPIHPQQIQPEGGREAPWDRAGVGRQRTQVIFADGEERPAVFVAQGQPQLLEEGLFGVTIDRGDGQDFLELVEDQNVRRGGSFSPESAG